MSRISPVRRLCLHSPLPDFSQKMGSGKLSIRQKVNGKDAPLSWLQTQIKSRLSEKPIEVAPIIQEILRAA